MTLLIARDKTLLRNAELLFHAPTLDSPFYCDSNFGLLLEIRDPEMPYIRVLGDCCGLPLEAVSAELFSKVLRVRCCRDYNFNKKFLRTSPKYIRHTLDAVLPHTKLNPRVESLAKVPITDRITKVIGLWRRGRTDKWRDLLIENSGPLFPIQ